MDNTQFLAILKKSFITYLQTDSRSNKKLEVLHGAISNDLYERLNDNKYTIHSLGYNNGKEHRINGRYVDKVVDITISENDKPIAGIAVKFVMSNYKQNSNNYFENMLGETANLRSAKIPYYQIFVIADQVPYFKKSNELSKFEKINEHNLKKYIVLSNDNISDFMHTPVKTLIFVIHINNLIGTPHFSNKIDYISYYLNNDFNITISPLTFNFGDAVIYNDYSKFIQKVAYSIKSL